MLIELLVGLSFQTQPENGTWYDLQYGFTKFRQLNYAAGVGLRGDNWAVEYQDLGNEFSEYTDQNSFHFDGHQHPRGVWAVWEPHIGDSWYARAGLGVDKPNFNMRISGIPNTEPFSVGNNHVAPSYLVGGGFRVREHVDAVFDVRYVYASVKGAQNPALSNFPNLGKFAASLQVRYAF